MRLKRYTEAQCYASFWSKVRIGGLDECWNWLNSVTPYGYGVFGKHWHETMGAHRYAYISSRSQIPKGLCVLHRCDNRRCCNPTHLFLGTKKDNTHDCMNKGRFAIGNQMSHAKLSPQKVRIILSSYKGRGNPSQRFLAERFKVSQRLISLVIHRKAWNHVSF